VGSLEGGREGGREGGCREGWMVYASKGIDWPRSMRK
jgi:hypothetical protein